MSRKPVKIYLRVKKGVLVPADNYAASMLRERGYAIGDVIGAVLTKLRNPRFNRLVHRIGALCAANISDFTGMDAHKVIKRIQLEGNIHCEETAIKISGLGMCVHLTPLSIGFETLDEGEYRVVARNLCRHIAEKYWPDLTPEAIEEMAQNFVGEA